MSLKIKAGRNIRIESGIIIMGDDRNIQIQNISIHA